MKRRQSDSDDDQQLDEYMFGVVVMPANPDELPMFIISEECTEESRHCFDTPNGLKHIVKFTRTSPFREAITRDEANILIQNAPGRVEPILLAIRDRLMEFSNAHMNSVEIAIVNKLTMAVYLLIIKNESMSIVGVYDDSYITEWFCEHEMDRDGWDPSVTNKKVTPIICKSEWLYYEGNRLPCTEILGIPITFRVDYGDHDVVQFRQWGTDPFHDRDWKGNHVYKNIQGVLKELTSITWNYEGNWDGQPIITESELRLHPERYFVLVTSDLPELPSTSMFEHVMTQKGVPKDVTKEFIRDRVPGEYPYTTFDDRGLSVFERAAWLRDEEKPVMPPKFKKVLKKPSETWIRSILRQRGVPDSSSIARNLAQRYENVTRFPDQ